MKPLFVILAFCALMSDANSQSIALLNWTCTEGQQVESLCMQYNTVTILYETSWTDGQPKKIGAVLDGHTLQTRWKFIYEPGVDTITIRYPFPFPGYYYEPGVVLDMFNVTQTIHYDGTSGDQSYVRVYRAPVYFDVGQPVAGPATISGQAHVSDWNVPEALPGPDDCGGKESRVEIRLISCTDSSVLGITEYIQTFDTPDYYDYTFDCPAFTSVRVEMRLLHMESDISGPIGPVISSAVATTTSDCMMADMSTGINTPAAPSVQMEPVIIYDATGKVVRTGMSSPSSVRQMMEDLGTGLYIVQTGDTPPYRVLKDR